MKTIILTLFSILCFGITLYAQIDASKKTVNIKAIDSSAFANTKFSVKLLPIEGLTNKKNKPSINYTHIPDLYKRPSGIDVREKSKLVQKTWVINQRFGEDQKDLSKFSRDYNLGDFKTTSKTVIIQCRDHEYVDGDRIKLMLNNVVIHPNITLRGDFYTIDIDLKEGFNTVNFIALNEGDSSPNTAELRILDADGNVLASNTWLLRTGYKASLIIVKE